MRNIPSELLQKINKKYQTKYNEADPKIHLVFHRSERYIEQGGLIVPRTVLEDPPVASPGSWDTALMREVDRYKTFPSHIYRIDTDGTTAKVTRAPYDEVFATTEIIDFEWEDLNWSVEDAVEVAIEFNGYWVRTAKDADLCFDSTAAWTHITEGEPYAFRVNSAGALHVQQRNESAVELVASGVTKIAAIRSWKNVYTWEQDHGLIIAYVKNNAVYYRTFANQGTEENPQPPAWEEERAVASLPTPAQDVEVFRTNDYRTGFLCEHNGEIHWAITDRNWSGMAIADHIIEVEGTELLSNLIAIFYRDGFHAHTIEAQGTEVQALYCPAIWPSVLDVDNPDEFTIAIHVDMPLHGDLTGLEGAFTVTDGISADVPVSATAKGIGYVSETNTYFIQAAFPANLSTEGQTCTILLTVSDIDATEGDLTVSYDYSAGPIHAQVQGGCLMELDSFNITFTPVRDPVVGLHDETLTIAGTEVLADFIAVDYEDGHSEDTLTVEGTEVLADFIEVDPVDP